MKSKIAFTKKDIAVVLVCLVFLLMSLGAIGSGGRERFKRAVCLSNLKQLSLAWYQYADDNDGRIVNGAPIGTKGRADVPDWDCDHGDCINYPPTWWETPWVGNAIDCTTIKCQTEAIKAGALWPYCKNLKLYRCPTGQRGEMLTYSIMDGMNGLTIIRGDVKGRPGVWIKKMSEIHSPPPAKRMVFIDEGFVTPDSFGVFYGRERWFDNPPSRHGGGVCLSFADGHIEHRKWKGMWTIIYARVNKYVATREFAVPGDPIDMTPGDGMDGPYEYVPATCDDFDDLYYIQKGCWGGLSPDYSSASGCPR